MNLLKSRTVWLAIGQAVLGVIIVVLTEADMVGYAVLVKSLADVFMRSITTDAINDK